MTRLSDNSAPALPGMSPYVLLILANLGCECIQCNVPVMIVASIQCEFKALLLPLNKGGCLW